MEEGSFFLGSSSHQNEFGLDGDVIDMKSLKDKVDILILVQDILLRIENDVNGSQGLLGSQTPDVQLVNTGDTGNLEEEKRIDRSGATWREKRHEQLHGASSRSPNSSFGTDWLAGRDSSLLELEPTAWRRCDECLVHSLGKKIMKQKVTKRRQKIIGSTNRL